MGMVVGWLSRGNRGLWLSLVLFALLASLAWVGFMASDDATYIRGAFGWLEHFPYVGGHGTIRYPITIPIALSFLIFGEGEFSAVVPSLFYLLAFFLFAWRTMRSIVGPFGAFVVMLALVTSPLILVQSTVAGVDVIELALLFGAVFLFWHCLQNGVRPALLLGAGALVGFAFLARETAIFIVPFFGLLFLMGYRMSRLHYLWIPAGFLAVWGCELLYLGVMTGDPFYRINISLHHDSSIDRTIDLAGNVLVNPWLDPLLVLLLNQEFMLLMYFAIPLGVWLCFSKRIEPGLQSFARLIAWLGLSWFILVALLQSLLPLNPRYFMMVSTSACMLTGLALGQLMTCWKRRWRWAGGGLLLLLLSSNLVGIAVENKNPIFGERELAEWLEADKGATVVTDPMTLYRAEYLLQWRGLTDRVQSRAPQAGDLYYYNPVRSAQPNARMKKDKQRLFTPQARWELLRTFNPEPDVLAIVLERLGGGTLLPSSLREKLYSRTQPAYLYRVR